MVEARPLAARRDREIDARIVEHPFGVVRLHHGGLRGEQRGIEADGPVEVLDTDVNMHALHGTYSSQEAGTFVRFDRAGLQAAGAQVSGAPLQQFSVRIAEQRVHRVVLRGVDHRAAVAPHRHEARPAQPVEVKRQRIRRETERCRDLPGRKTIRSRLHQQPEDIEAIVLGERGQGRDGV